MTCENHTAEISKACSLYCLAKEQAMKTIAHHLTSAMHCHKFWQQFPKYCAVGQKYMNGCSSKRAESGNPAALATLPAFSGVTQARTIDYRCINIFNDVHTRRENLTAIITLSTLSTRAARANYSCSLCTKLCLQDTLGYMSTKATESKGLKKGKVHPLRAHCMG